MVEKLSIAAAVKVVSSLHASNCFSLANNPFSFPKKLRVTKSTEYKRLSLKGKRLYGTSLVADLLHSSSRAPKPRVGITVSKKYGKAHQRNRFKRLVKEAFRLNQHLLPQTLIINIRPSNKTKGNPSLEAITQDLMRLFIPTKPVTLEPALV